MPTAARLAAAICLAVVALAVSVQIMPQMPEDTDFGYFVPVNMGLGLLCGWVVMGRRPRAGLVGALNNGIVGVVVLVFWALVVQGGYEMLRLAMNRRYHGPIEAIYGVIEETLAYAPLLLTPGILATLAAGTILSGIVTERAGRIWR